MNILRGVKKICHYIKWKPRIKSFGFRSEIIKPHIVRGNIKIGKNVIIKEGCWLETSELTGNSDSLIRIGENCDIGRFVELFATKEIILENDVLLGERIYISDNLHRYEDISKPIHSQGVIQNGHGVTVGEGTWIGSGACVLGASIGKHCVVGCNAVVNKDIPDYCVAVGVPAKIIKKYNSETRSWEKVDEGHDCIINAQNKR